MTKDTDKKSKEILKRNDVTGVTMLHGKIVKVYFGRDTIVDTIHGTQRNIFSNRKYAIRLDSKTISTIIRRGRKWLKIPAGSVILRTTYKPLKGTFKAL